MIQTHLIMAAGGNGTAIQTLDQPLSRKEYVSRGKVLGEKMERFGAEQAGFLISGHSHFEMAGGEFCGNASRAVAVLFSELKGRSKIAFTVSGFEGTVHAAVIKKADALYDVLCEFPNLPTEVTSVMIADKQSASIVDLGGIVHVVIEATFPEEATLFQATHRDIMEQFGLSEREAVGVIWFEKNQENVTIHPVVWVKAVDTFFYEESCGSGAIAASRVTGMTNIIQPTGKMIRAEVTEEGATLESEMEIIF